MAIDLLGAAGVGLAGKTKCDIGLELVSAAVEIYALEVDLAVFVIKDFDDLGKNRCQRDPIVTQYEAAGVMGVKVAQRQRAEGTTGSAWLALAAVCHTARDEIAVLGPERKQFLA